FGCEGVIIALPINAILAPPHDAATVAFEQQMPEAPPSVVRIGFKDCSKDRFARHEGAQNLARIADIVRLDPIHGLREPPQIISAKSVRHLRSFNADRGRGVYLMGGSTKPIQSASQGEIHVSAE